MKRFAGFVLTLLLVRVRVAVAAPPSPPHFSADVTVTGHGEPMTGKMWIDGDKHRMEMTAHGHHVINILRMDRQVAYNVMPDQGFYMEVPLASAPQPSAGAWSSDSQLTLLGTETVNGQVCDKYSITHNGQPSGFLWKVKGGLIPVRYVSADGQSQVDYTNVKMGPQDPSLFEPPAGMRKMDIPGGMMMPHR